MHPWRAQLADRHPLVNSAKPIFVTTISPLQPDKSPSGNHRPRHHQLLQKPRMIQKACLVFSPRGTGGTALRGPRWGMTTAWQARLQFQVTWGPRSQRKLNLGFQAHWGMERHWRRDRWGLQKSGFLSRLLLLLEQGGTLVHLSWILALWRTSMSTKKEKNRINTIRNMGSKLNCKGRREIKLWGRALITLVFSLSVSEYFLCFLPFLHSLVLLHMLIILQ